MKVVVENRKQEGGGGTGVEDPERLHAIVKNPR